MRDVRLFVAGELLPGRTLTLEPDRSHYLCRVLRQRRGDQLAVFAGDGNAYDAVILTADTRACEITIGACTQTQAAPRLRLHLGQAMIKSDRADWVLQKATELGVTDIWLLTTQRTEVHVVGERRARRERHWQRIIEGACEQCGRLWLPRLHGPLPFPDLLNDLPDAQIYLLDPAAPPLQSSPVADALLLVGPEGGFTDPERDTAVAAGATLLGLGETILRADTAAVAAITVLRQAWGWAAP